MMRCSRPVLSATRSALVRAAVAGLLLVATTALLPAVAGARPRDDLGSARRASSPGYGTTAYNVVVALSRGIGPRVADTNGDRRARAYIVEALRADGLAPSVQEFAGKAEGGQTVNGWNVTATKSGASSLQVIVGAHYDSVAVGRGAFDNATGVGALLEVAKRASTTALPYSVRFVAFDDEELGLLGSAAYVRRMTATEKSATVLMINLDSVATGDYLYVYAGAGKASWPRLVLQGIARQLGIKLRTNPGLNPAYPFGTTGDWSDHAAFAKAGIPVAYFEATNWLIGDKDGYLNTTKDGEIWHSDKDTLAFINEWYPGRMRAQLASVVHVIMDYLGEPQNVPVFLPPVVAP